MSSWLSLIVLFIGFISWKDAASGLLLNWKMAKTGRQYGWIIRHRQYSVKHHSQPWSRSTTTRFWSLSPMTSHDNTPKDEREYAKTASDMSSISPRTPDRTDAFQRIFLLWGLSALVLWSPMETHAEPIAMVGQPSSLTLATPSPLDDASLLDAFGSQLMMPSGTSGSTPGMTSSNNNNGKGSDTTGDSSTGTGQSDLGSALQEMQLRKRIDPRTHG